MKNVKNVNVMVWTVAGAMAMLAGLGLAVAGFVAPDTMGPYWFLKRQAVSVGLAVGVTLAAAFVPWRTWLRAAPWIFAGYLLVFVGSAACPLVDGWHRYLILGPVKLDTWVIGWPVGALMLAWLRTKLPLSSRWLLSSVIIAGMFCFSGGVLRNSNRVERLNAFFTGKAETLPVPPEAIERNERAKAIKEAYLSSELIGESNPVVIKAVPLAHTASVSTGVAVHFGRLVHWAMLGLFSTIGVLLLLIGRNLVDSPKRIFVFLYAVWLVGLAWLNTAECLHYVPTFGVSIPLVSVGMTSSLVSGLGLGIITSMVRRG